MDARLWLRVLEHADELEVRALVERVLPVACRVTGDEIQVRTSTDPR
jgi:hypothetical protein